ncbi:unnamed protein product, partial [marine sediment metagenome]
VGNIAENLSNKFSAKSAFELMSHYVSGHRFTSCLIP